MNNLTFKTNKHDLFICAKLVLIKILYILSISYFLPDKMLLWSFDKDVTLINIFIEMIPFFIVLVLYLFILRKEKTYTVFCTALFILWFIPNNSILSLSNYHIYYFLLLQVFSIVLFSLMLVFSPKNKTNRHSIYINFRELINNKNMKIFMSCLIIFVNVAILIYVYMYNGLNFSISLLDMYDVRASYSDYAVNIQGSFLSYLFMIITSTSKWVLPICLYYAIRKKSYFNIFLSLLSFLALFTVEMQKTTLMFVLVIIAVAFVDKNRKLNKLNIHIINTFLYLLIFTFIESYVFKTNSIFNAIVNRCMYTPSYLTHTYYTYFSTMGKIWFTQDTFILQNIVSKIISVGHNENMIKLISKNCFDGLMPSPNTGLFAEAYGHMGIFGCIFFPFIIVAFINFIYKISSYYGPGITCIIMLRLVINIVNTKILTSNSMIGVIVFYLISILLIRHQKRNNLKERYKNED